MGRRGAGRRRARPPRCGASWARCGSVLDRADADAERAQHRVANLRAKLERLDAEAARAAEQLAAAPPEADVAGAMAAAAAARAAAEETARAAEQRRDAAQAERHTWTARADALALALDDARSRAGAERLAAVEGVVGTLLDLVDIDPGWEAAAEAACGEALDAVVVDSVTSGRRALQVLAEGDVPGAVLAMGVAPARRSPPPVGEPVLAHVRPRRPEVAPLLDGLLGSAVAVEGGWTAAVDAALAHPDAVVVTRERRPLRRGRLAGVHRHDRRHRCRAGRGSRPGHGGHRGRGGGRRGPPRRSRGAGRGPRRRDRGRRRPATAGSARSPPPPRRASGPRPTATTRSPSST